MLHKSMTGFPKLSIFIGDLMNQGAKAPAPTQEQGWVDWMGQTISNLSETVGISYDADALWSDWINEYFPEPPEAARQAMAQGIEFVATPATLLNNAGKSMTEGGRTLSLQSQLWAVSGDKNYCQNYADCEPWTFKCSCLANHGRGSHTSIGTTAGGTQVSRCMPIFKIIDEAIGDNLALTAINSFLVGPIREICLSPFETVYEKAKQSLQDWLGPLGGQVDAAENRVMDSFWERVDQETRSYMAILCDAARPKLRSKTSGKTLDFEWMGCERAQALVALLLGELNLDAIDSDPNNYKKTVAVLMSPHGPKIVTGAMYGQAYDAR